MREVVTQLAVIFILWSLVVELTGWALQAWLGERWWQKVLGQQRREEPQPQTVPISRSE